MIQVYADERLIFDTRLEDYTLLGLRVTTGLNKSGTAEIVMPPDHPGYDSFTSYKTIVTIYQDGVLVFRGRALYPSDDYYKSRTIVCEGERGFLQDGILRPYLYQDSPAAIFAHVVGLYNAQVDAFKRFTVGRVTVTDANGYIRMEKDSAETCAEFFDKLLDRCGGYITFTTNKAGKRVINWLAEIGTQSGQAIEFGSNLLDYTKTGESPDLATVLVPYGARQEDGTRVDITSVTTTGVDYVEDREAIALRGRIVATATWDDVTVPANLLRKAREWLAEHRLAVTSLTLSAVDLSRLDRSIDSYQVGDMVRVVSRPHGLDAYFQLTERELDLLDGAEGQITLGKTTTSLTGADVARDKGNTTALDRVAVSYKTDLAAVQQETGQQVAAAVEVANEAAAAVGEKLGADAIVDNLETDDATKVLSAAQGVVLKALIDEGGGGTPGEPGADGKDGEDGVGIETVEQTTTSTEDGGANIVTVTLTDGSSSTFQVLNGSRGAQGEQGPQGEKGDPGDAAGVEIVDNLTTNDSTKVLSAAQGVVLNNKWNGCWIEFTDEDGNPTDEPYIHWLEEA